MLITLNDNVFCFVLFFTVCVFCVFVPNTQMDSRAPSSPITHSYTHTAAAAAIKHGSVTCGVLSRTRHLAQAPLNTINGQVCLYQPYMTSS